MVVVVGSKKLNGAELPVFDKLLQSLIIFFLLDTKMNRCVLHEQSCQQSEFVDYVQSVNSINLFLYGSSMARLHSETNNKKTSFIL